MHPRDAKQAALKAIDEADRLADILQGRVAEKERELVAKIRAEIRLAVARLKDV